MTDPDPRWDPEMWEARRRMDEAAARHPPVLPQEPFAPHRAVSDLLNLEWVEGGPAMAQVEERWILAHGRRVLCRVNRPAGCSDAAPALVWLHGGGWVWSSVDTHDRLAREYAAAAGVVVVSVDYSLSPEAKFPRAVFECAEVMAALGEHAAAWGIDAARLAIGGDSAGGNLALGTTLLLRDREAALPRGVLTCYPVTQAVFDTPSYTEFDDGYGLTRASMQAYWDLYLRDPADRLNPLAAPAFADLTGLPPTLIQLAELDVLRGDGEVLEARMRAAGVTVTLERYAGVAHGFMRLTGAVGRAREAVAKAGRWLSGVMA